MQLTALTPEIYMHLYRDILEFRCAFDLPVDDPQSLDLNSDTLHTSLIIEELTELAQAPDKVDQADAIVDSVYVLMGRQVHLGADTPEANPAISYLVDLLLHVARNLNINFIPCWVEVHSSNMSKLCRTELEYTATEAFYAAQGIALTASHKGGFIIAKCAEDVELDGKTIRAGKVLKNVNYRRADLGPLVL
ncbi:MAG: nucleoside triphosphate pyrophosphohydrolase family protein [Shewanella sp.]|nr:nucleoside triphosphate pyrophosphohydrolase family protein [Shewanella sp.]MCF1431589.1 nucleoside triphosphate pyrophosphohydrolase family protein [Shewanella sp.]MCF1438070.1 nucleoside triphosphate pyrophosphohydrolase family protein [Shewanella sp.]MCF1458321.1 nucleoside triphosphate pyrophosphohydrolase family protein [Shewanella sp.]